MNLVELAGSSEPILLEAPPGATARVQAVEGRDQEQLQVFPKHHGHALTFPSESQSMGASRRRC